MLTVFLIIMQKKMPLPKWPNWMCPLLDLLVVWCRDLWVLDILLPQRMVLFHQCKILHCTPISVSVNHYSSSCYTLQLLRKVYSVYEMQILFQKDHYLAEDVLLLFYCYFFKNMFLLVPCLYQSITIVLMFYSSSFAYNLVYEPQILVQGKTMRVFSLKCFSTIFFLHFF